MALREYRPWGYAPPSAPSTVVPVVWRSNPPALARVKGSVLPFGCGRSYGDSCLNGGGGLLDVAPLNRIIAYDPQAGILRCEAGVTLAEILGLAVPQGWFLPVVPGTKWVSIGGAIANDIHGKNHHRAGTFGTHVTGFELLRSTGERVLCSPLENVQLFRATIGGLGLTGLILWADVQLKRIPGSAIAMAWGISSSSARATGTSSTRSPGSTASAAAVRWVAASSCGASTARDPGRRRLPGTDHRPTRACRWTRSIPS